jgi:hypothetical protein
MGTELQHTTTNKTEPAGAHARQRWWQFRPPLDRVRATSATTITVVTTWTLIDSHVPVVRAIVALAALVGLVGRDRP